MADEKLQWLDVIRKGPEGPVLVGLTGASLVVLGSYHCGVVTVSESWLWLPWSIAPFAILVLASRAALGVREAWKKRPCAFSKLKQVQQEFLKQQVQSDSRRFDSERLDDLHWYKELIRLNYIKSYYPFGEITEKGWKEVEKHLAGKK